MVWITDKNDPDSYQDTDLCIGTYRYFERSRRACEGMDDVGWEMEDVGTYRHLSGVLFRRKGPFK